MERFAMDRLTEWKVSKNRKPLIIGGARCHWGRVPLTQQSME